MRNVHLLASLWCASLVGLVSAESPWWENRRFREELFFAQPRGSDHYDSLDAAYEYDLFDVIECTIRARLPREVAIDVQPQRPNMVYAATQLKHTGRVALLRDVLEEKIDFREPSDPDAPEECLEAYASNALVLAARGVLQSNTTELYPSLEALLARTRDAAMLASLIREVRQSPRAFFLPCFERLLEDSPVVRSEPRLSQKVSETIEVMRSANAVNGGSTKTPDNQGGNNQHSTAEPSDAPTPNGTPGEGHRTTGSSYQWRSGLWIGIGALAVVSFVLLLALLKRSKTR